MSPLPSGVPFGPVCVFGGANMDVSAQTFTPLVQADSTPGTIACSPGGVARNVAENLARLGVVTHLVSVVGNDIFGQRLADATRAAGVNLDALMTLPMQRTATYLSLHGSDGDMAFAVNDMDILVSLTPQLLLHHEALIGSAACWVLDCNISAQTLAWLFEEPNRPTLFVDAVSVAKCQKILPWLDRIHTLKANRLEAQTLSGLTINDVTQAQLAALNLHDVGITQVVISLGEQGVCWCDAVGVTGFRASRRVKVVNTTGAGDALLAGLVHGHLMHLPLAQAVEFATACAEITLCSPYANAPGLSSEAVYSRLSSQLTEAPS